MEPNKILSADILDLVFEGRNKDYGAYELRKSYKNRLGRALLITSAIAILALLASLLASAKKGNSKLKMQEMTIQDLKQDEKKEPPPPPPPPPPKQEPPKVEMKQFTPPVIKKDEEVEKPPPPQEELKEIFRCLEQNLNSYSNEFSGLSLTVPMAFIEGNKQGSNRQ